MFLSIFFICAVIPFLLVVCQYAGADKIFPDQFNELPFLPKENLISYHTEGRGEDKVGIHVCLGTFFVLFNVDM